MSRAEATGYIREILENVKTRSRSLGGVKSSAARLSDPAQAKLKRENADRELRKLKEYKDYYKERLKTMQDSGQRGRGVLFYSEPEELLKN